LFSAKDSGVFPPIKGTPTDDRYKNTYFDKIATSPKKFVLREELISKVVHSQQSKLKQHRIFSGNVLSNQHAIKSKKYLSKPGGRTSSKMDDDLKSKVRNKSPF
jgi:hypothetical protein